MSSFARRFCATGAVMVPQVPDCAIFTQAFGPDENQDSALVARRGTTLLLAVADGVGGLPGGARASKAALDELSSSFAKGDSTLHAIENANEAVRAVRGSATTLVVAEIQGRVLRTFHAGDSQCAVFSGQRRLKGITAAHSVTGLGIEAGLIRPSELRGHPERHVVTNSLGDPALRIEVMRWPRLSKRDFILLASDGLFDNLEIDELSPLISSPVDVAVESMAQECHRRMESGEPSTKVDDLSIVLWHRGA